MPWQLPVTLARVSPIFGSKPNSEVHRGASITPSRLMNSCTRILPIGPPGSVSGHSTLAEGGPDLYRQTWRDDEEELDGAEVQPGCLGTVRRVLAVDVGRGLDLGDVRRP